MDLIFMNGETIKYNYNNKDIINIKDSDFLLIKNIILFLQELKQNKCKYSLFSLENGENKYNRYIPVNINKLFVLEIVYNQIISEEFIYYFEKYFEENHNIDYNIIENYLKNGADPDCYSSRYRQTCLHLVCRLDKFDIAKLLLSYDANPSPESKLNYTSPLHLSVNLENDNITQLLLENGADINAEDRLKWTPIYNAVWNIDIRNLKTLIKYNANINHKSTSKWTPLHVACNSTNNLYNHVELLIKLGANINIYDYKGVTPLYLACMRRAEYIIKILIKNGADPNLKTNNSMSSYEFCKKHEYSFLQKLNKN
jgi:ankyrin repeat protein